MENNLKTTFLIATCLLVVSAQAQGQLSLDRAIASSRANRPTLSAARQKLLSAQLSHRALGAFPATQLFAGYTSPAEVGGSDDDLVLAQPIDIFGRTAASRSAGNAGVKRAEAELRSTLSELQNDVITLYCETAASASLAQSAEESKKIAKDLEQATRKLVEEGRLPGVQLSRISIEAERARIVAKQRKAEYEANQLRLATAIGLPVAEVTVTGFPNVVPVSVEKDKLTSQRGDLMILAAEVREAEAEARIATTNALPELEVQGRRTPWQESNVTYGVRVQLSIPLYDFGKARNERKAALTRAAAARASLEDAARIAKAEVDAAQIEAIAAQEQITSLEAVQRSTRDLVERTQVGLREGASTLFDVIDSLRALREAEESLAEARLALVLAQARSLKASGLLLEVN